MYEEFTTDLAALGLDADAEKRLRMIGTTTVEYLYCRLTKASDSWKSKLQKLFGMSYDELMQKLLAVIPEEKRQRLNELLPFGGELDNQQSDSSASNDLPEQNERKDNDFPNPNWN